MSKNLSFRSRMLAQILPVVIIGLFTLSFIIYWQVYTTVETEIYNNMQSRTGETASNINLWLKSKLVDIEIYAANPIAQKVNVDRQAMADMHYSRLSKVLQLFPEEKPINVYSIESDGNATGAVFENGTIVIKTINVSDMGYFKRIMSGEPGYMKEPQYARSVKGVIIGPSAPIKKDGNVIGIVGATFSTELITKKISNLRFGEKGYGMVISADGNYIEHPDPRKISANDSPELNNAITRMSDEPDKYLQELCYRMLTEESGTFKFVQDGKTKIAFYQQIPVAKWSAVSVIDAEELFAPANHLLYVMLIISLFVIAMLSIIIYFTSVRLTVPLQQLSSFAKLLAGSDFSEGNKMSSGNEEQVESYKISTKLLHAAPQEVEQLGLTFNYMAERIKNNIEALNRTNQALRSSEEKFSKAFYYSSDAIVLIRTSDKCVMEINDAFVNVLGFSREEIINKSINEFQLWYDPEQRAATMLTLANDGKVKNIETRWRYKSGEVRVGLYSAETLVINDEECRLIAWRDIMERKQSEEALRLANEDLKAMNEELQNTLAFVQKAQKQLVQSEKMVSLGSLVAGVAHEINTPLGVGVTAASHLQGITKKFGQMYESKTVTRRDFEEYLSDCSEATVIILTNLERASNLVRCFKRVSVDQSSEAKRVFNVKEYIYEILLSLQPKMKKSRQTVEVKCDEELEMDGLPGALAQIITNLIINSLLHAYDPHTVGKISIDVMKNDKQEVCLTYSDNGKGVDQATLAHIFDPFFTTKRGVGTGLGLYILYNIVTQQFGGTISCESELTKGTTFKICWPLKQAVKKIGLI